MTCSDACAHRDMAERRFANLCDRYQYAAQAERVRGSRRASTRTCTETSRPNTAMLRWRRTCTKIGHLESPTR